MTSLLRGIRRVFAPDHPWSETLHSLRDASILVTGAYVTYHVFTTTIGGITHTEGISMTPTIPHSYRKRPFILYSSLHRRGRNIKVGDVVTYANPVLPHSYGCKRVIGMPGDFVSVVTPGRRDGDVGKDADEGDWASVKEQVIRVPEGHCWVVGDNMEWSRDSRLFGPLPLGLIKAKVLAVVLPREESRWLGSGEDVVDYKGKEKEWVIK